VIKGHYKLKPSDNKDNLCKPEGDDEDASKIAEDSQRNRLFYTQCNINNIMFDFIIDSGISKKNKIANRSTSQTI
jgi:hypothetical protein